MKQNYYSSKTATKQAIEKRESVQVPWEKIRILRQNNIYSGTSDIFTAIIEDKDGVERNKKSFNDYTNAVLWSQGMLSESEDGAYKILDTDTKTVLCSKRKQKNDWVDYANKLQVKQVEVPGLEVPEVPKMDVPQNSYSGPKTNFTKKNTYFGTIENEKKTGKILWISIRDGNGVIKDDQGNEFYFDKSSSDKSLFEGKSDVEMRGKQVSFESGRAGQTLVAKQVRKNSIENEDNKALDLARQLESGGYGKFARGADRSLTFSTHSGKNSQIIAEKFKNIGKDAYIQTNKMSGEYVVIVRKVYDNSIENADKIDNADFYKGVAIVGDSGKYRVRGYDYHTPDFKSLGEAKSFIDKNPLKEKVKEESKEDKLKKAMEQIKKQFGNELTPLETGTKIEMEHAETIKKVLKMNGKDQSDEQVRKIAEMIAKDHLEEDPEYYTKLKKMENSLSSVSQIKDSSWYRHPEFSGFLLTGQGWKIDQQNNRYPISKLLKLIEVIKTSSGWKDK